VLPAFNPDGVLPPGDYELAIQELKQSELVHGPSPSLPGWDTIWRATLASNLETIVNQLWNVGITEIFANGSFATNKLRPGDIDVYFECEEDSIKSGSC